jgi:hypothetical protein
MKPYTYSEAESLVQELKDACVAFTDRDTRWYRRVHAEITHHMVETCRERNFCELEDQYLLGKMPANNYYTALISLLVGEANGSSWPAASDR